VAANGTSGLNAQVVSGRLNMKNYWQSPDREGAVSTTRPDLAGLHLLRKARLIDVSRLKNAFRVTALGHADHGSA
jgi:hypothetical protein